MQGTPPVDPSIRRDGANRNRYIRRVTLGYGVCAALWILFTDPLLAALADRTQVAWLSTAKGIAFVIATAALLYLALGSVPAATDDRGAVGSAGITEMKRTEQALDQERQRLKVLFQTLPDLVWLKDPDGVFLACNPRFESLFGAKESEILGRTDLDFVDATTARFCLESDRAAIAAGRSLTNEEELTFRSDGHRELLEIIKTPMLDAQGTLIGVLGIGRDITATRAAALALRESEGLKRAVLDSVSSHIAVLDGSGAIVAVNRPWERFALDNSPEPGQPVPRTGWAGRGLSRRPAREPRRGVRRCPGGT